MSMSDQVLSLFAAKNGYLDSVPTEEVREFEKLLHRYFRENGSDIINEIEEKGVLSEELTGKIHKVMEEALNQFKLVKGVN